MAKITKTLIEAWKKQYGDVYELSYAGKKAYLSKPGRNTLRLAFSKAATDPLGMAEVILNNCWLGGDDEFRKDDTYFLGVVSQIDKIVTAKEVELKKL